MNGYETGIAVVSLDTERMWGYYDLLSETDYARRFPDYEDVHEWLVECFSRYEIPATWDVVGGLALAGSAGPKDPMFLAVPEDRRGRLQRGNQSNAPAWYARDFVLGLKHAAAGHEIALHGGLSHLSWTEIGRETARAELAQGIEALRWIGIEPVSFVFPRDLVAHLELIREAGIRCYRGRAPILSERAGYNALGAGLRLYEELSRSEPPAVLPVETLPGLWNLPASMLLYSLSEARARVAPLARRVERTAAGLEAAARRRGIFHLALHPENVSESEAGRDVFESLLYLIARRRELGDIQILTMQQALAQWTCGEAELEEAARSAR